MYNIIVTKNQMSKTIPNQSNVFISCTYQAYVHGGMI